MFCPYSHSFITHLLLPVSRNHLLKIEANASELLESLNTCFLGTTCIVLDMNISPKRFLLQDISIIYHLGIFFSFDEINLICCNLLKHNSPVYIFTIYKGNVIANCRLHKPQNVLNDVFHIEMCVH